MNTRLHTVAALTAISLSMLVCHGAKACSATDGPPGQMAMLPAGSPGVLATSASMLNVGDTVPGMTNPLQQMEPITGLYTVTFTAEGNASIPDGKVILGGLDTWHADGTELLNSNQTPLRQAFCMGVWTRTGPQDYRLNHWALLWTTSGATYVGPAQVREYIRLSRDGNSYAGNFILIQYAPDGTTQLSKALGTVTGTRIKP